MEYLTVAEFSNCAGVSKQAVYKRMKTDLKEFVKVKDGVKTISTDGLKLFNKVEMVEQPETTDGLNAQSPRSTDYEKKIEEQAQTIKSQEETIRELTERVNELNKRVLEQNDELLNLVKKQVQQQENFQILLAQQQKLLSQTVETVEIVEQPEVEPKKKGLFKRLFGR